ncbi:MAG: hypothetical protein JWP37_3603 [Mucilaginibacter sp.]|nr:hypothetical protein [Mucilaginibacter sp.]
MKPLTTISLALLCLFYSCKQSDRAAPTKISDQGTSKRSVADSIEIQAKATKMAHDMMQHAKDSASNTSKRIVHAVPARSFGPCPAAIKECLVVTDRNGKSIIVTLKNNSAKKIDVVGISWVVYNKLNKRIGNSNGKAKKVLARGKSTSYAWGINASTGTHAKASVYSIHYKDGSLWQAGGDMR